MLIENNWPAVLDARFPRFPLAFLPTPLEFLENLSLRLNGPRIFMKRDDLTGLALGGDKPRKLEYLFGDALKQNCDVVLTAGSSQSNHIRLTAAAARKAGIEAIGFTLEDEHASNTGNLLLSRLLGMDLRFHQVHDDDHWALVPLMEAEADRLRRQGRKPYVIPVSGTAPLACLGYVRAAFELEEQYATAGIEPTHMYITCGTGGNIASLMVGMSLAGRALPVTGISVNRGKAEAAGLVRKWFGATAALLNVEAREDFEIDDAYLGTGYGKLTEECREAILLTAQSDGVLLDPVYTGKTMSGLIGHIREGRLTKRDTVVVIHTGGIPALFAYAEALTGIPI